MAVSQLAADIGGEDGHTVDLAWSPRPSSERLHFERPCRLAAMLRLVLGCVSLHDWMSWPRCSRLRSETVLGGERSGSRQFQNAKRTRVPEALCIWRQTETP